MFSDLFKKSFKLNSYFLLFSVVEQLNSHNVGAFYTAVDIRSLEAMKAIDHKMKNIDVGIMPNLLRMMAKSQNYIGVSNMNMNTCNMKIKGHLD